MKYLISFTLIASCLILLFVPIHKVAAESSAAPISGVIDTSECGIVRLAVTPIGGNRMEISTLHATTDYQVFVDSAAPFYTHLGCTVGTGSIFYPTTSPYLFSGDVTFTVDEPNYEFWVTTFSLDSPVFQTSNIVHIVP